MFVWTSWELLVFASFLFRGFRRLEWDDSLGFLILGGDDEVIDKGEFFYY